MNTTITTQNVNTNNEIHAFVNWKVNKELEKVPFSLTNSAVSVLPTVIPQVYHNHAAVKAPVSKSSKKEFTEGEVPQGKVTHMNLEESRSKYLKMVRTHTGCKHARRAWIIDVYQIKTEENTTKVYADILTSHDIKRTIYLETITEETAKVEETVTTGSAK